PDPARPARTGGGIRARAGRDRQDHAGHRDAGSTSGELREPGWALHGADGAGSAGGARHRAGRTSAAVGRRGPNAAWRTAPGWRTLLGELVVGPMTSTGSLPPTESV